MGACLLALIAIPSTANASQCDTGPANSVWRGVVSASWFNPASSAEKS
jgi:hypothetical protein